MPTIHREDRFEIVIYTHDHPPPHVHVFDADGECVILVGDDETPPSLREVKRMRDHNVGAAFHIVQSRQPRFLERWREIHGY